MSEFGKVPPEQEAIMDNLRGQWMRMAGEIGGNTQNVRAAFSTFVDQYQVGDRAYHNLKHISRVDTFLNQYGHLAKNFPALKFAGDGHDLVYVAGSSTNEEESAEFMGRLMGDMQIPQGTIDETQRLILLTKYHQTSADDTDGKLMIDADLSVLALPGIDYDDYVDGIVAEYVRSGKYTVEQFKERRKQFILGMLDRKRIFLTEEVQGYLDFKARRNLGSELVDYI